MTLVATHWLNVLFSFIFRWVATRVKVQCWLLCWRSTR